MCAFRPIRYFIAWIVPGQVLATVVACLAARSAPGLAPAILLSLGFLGFAVAVSAAARPLRGRSAAHGQDVVLAVLDLRRHRARYALAFASLGVMFGAAGIFISGLGPAITPGIGHFLLAIGLGYVSSWLIIGEAACSQAAIRHALLLGRKRT